MKLLILSSSAVVMEEKSYTSTHPLGHNRTSNGITLPLPLLIVYFSPVPCYFLLDPNVFLSTLFSNTLSLHSYRNMRDQVSLTYRSGGKINK